MLWLRAPLLHFLALGALIYALDVRGQRPEASPAPRVSREIVVTADQVRQLREDYTRETGLPVTIADEAALVARAVDEELLYREALARGLDRGDRSVAWRLVEKMEFLGGGSAAGVGESPAERAARLEAARALGLERDDVVIRRMLVEKMRLVVKQAASAEEPTEAALRDYWERHRERWVQPATVAFWHVFVSRETRGPALAEDARRLLAALRTEETAPRAAVGRGDGFPLAPHVRAQSPRQLATSFGPEFAAAVMRLEPGAWRGPLASAYGLHLVWVESRQPEATAPLEAVRSKLLRGLHAERQQRRVQELLRRLRREYVVRVERPRGAQS